MVTEYPFIEETADTLVLSSKTHVSRYLIATAAALLAYAWATGFLLSHGMTKAYGFPVYYDVRTRIEIALQACPMLAAIFMVLISPAKDALNERFAGLVLTFRPGVNERLCRTLVALGVNVAFALATLAATACALAVVCAPAPDAPGVITLLWVAGEFMFDVTLIAVFTTALYALTRRLSLTILLLISYVVAVVFAGNYWGITSYIGFASGVPVMLTTYSDAPLYDTAGWLFRGYWACVTLLILSVLYAFDRPGEPLLVSIVRALQGRSRRWRIPLSFSFAVLLLCVLTGISLFRLQREGISKYQAASRATPDNSWRDEGARLDLTHFNLHLQYLPDAAMVAVQGNLTFANDAKLLRNAYFQVPGLVDLEDIRITGAGKYSLHTSGKYMQIQFDDALPGGRQVQVQYSGRIRPAGPFDLTVQAKVLRNGFFLNDADFIFAARQASCLTPEQTCGNDENYLMSDMASGDITVVAPRTLGVASPGEESVRAADGSASEHVFHIASPRLATFMVACAPFVQKTAVSNDGKTSIRVYGSAAAAANGGVQAELAKRILSFYQTAWPAYARPELQIVETPTPLGEGVAFDGAVAISDKIITSRDPVSGDASNLLEFVMAHEIAHQWWGYGVVPARAPGRLFLLESFPQFAAYEYLNSRGILNSEIAMRNEERRYQSARARLGKNEVPLAELATANELAYNKGPFVLLTLDGLGGHSLMKRLGGLIGSYSHDSQGNAAPKLLVDSLVNEMPEKDRPNARMLLFGPPTLATSHLHGAMTETVKDDK